MSFEIAIDAVRPDQLRPFWAEALGYVPHTAKNRLHLDIAVVAAERPERIRRLLALGGRVLTEHHAFVVLADPEGNELCLTDPGPWR